MLQHFLQGVRYLDVRLTYNVDKEDWYTTHTFLSDNAKEAFNEVNLFLEANKKEIIIFDIQHVYDERTMMVKQTKIVIKQTAVD